ncbi:type VI secretion protein [Streptomyces sp. BI20]|uniref:type VI secretion protein n=1 Tax=Streptomyces sp. BI20 TaxID=3403460 RepID=UPI003C743F0D
MARDAATPRPEQRGVPDGLLLGLLGFLLGIALLVWSSTGLAALFTKGSWPNAVSFTNTPPAIRALISRPHDLPGAWPATDPAALSGWGLFWGLFIGQLLVLFVLVVFGIGVVARVKTRRARARAGVPAPTPEPAPRETRRQDPAPTPTPVPHEPPPPPTPKRTTPPAPKRLPAPPRPKAVPTRAHAPAGPPPADDAYRYGFGYAPTTAARRPAAAPAPAAPRTPARTNPLAFGTPAERLAAALLAVTDAEGPLLVVTSQPDLWDATKDGRAKLGPVHLYDPGHRCDTPARLHWNPARGCADRAVARARAHALLAPVRPTARIDEAVADTAETLLRSWLHALALEDRPFKQAHRWAQGLGDSEPVRVLRTHPSAAAGAAGELESALTAHPQRREAALALTALALSSLSSVHIRESAGSHRPDALALDSFVEEGGTLYVVGESHENPRSDPGASPFLTALTAEVVARGRQAAERGAASRLSPPLALVLEDIAGVAPLPELPELLTDPTLPVRAWCRSPEQFRSRWPGVPLPG